MNVISTRAAGFFLIIGDIDVAIKKPSENVRQSSVRALCNPSGSKASIIVGVWLTETELRR